MESKIKIKTQEIKQVDLSFCTECGSYIHPEKGSFEIGKNGIAQLMCDNCYQNS